LGNWCVWLVLLKRGNNMLEEHTASFFRIGEARRNAGDVFARLRQKVI
jgi:hypothetical protein